MSRKTLPRIAVDAASTDTAQRYNETGAIFPRADHPDHRSTTEWHNACALRKFEKKFGKLNH
jgi:hypothetical protein